MRRACKIDGCERPSRSRGWCNTHYEYFRRHGLIEVKRFHNTDSRGERNGVSKLTKAEVLAIRAARGSHERIAERFGVAQTTISSIKRHASWAWLEA